MEDSAQQIYYKGGINGKRRDNWIKVDLSFGKYSLFVNGILGADKTLDIGISVYGLKEVSFSRLPSLGKYQTPEEYLSHAFIQKSLILPFNWLHMSRNQNSLKHKIRTFYVACSTDGYGFKVYRNKTGRFPTIRVTGRIQNGILGKTQLFGRRCQIFVLALPSL